MYSSFNCNGMLKDAAVGPNGHHPVDRPEQVNFGALRGRHFSIHEGFLLQRINKPGLNRPQHGRSEFGIYLKIQLHLLDLLYLDSPALSSKIVC